LNRAFIYAGASSVIASLWKVGDQATRDFMTTFYLFLATGKSKAEALRSAQRVIRYTNRQPRDWAGFVLTGLP
jgi:CHAT domain-containing protein